MSALWMPSKKRVLFLDVDGVLNTTNSSSLFSLTKPTLRQLKRIVEATDCHIVLSSTWRLVPDAFRHLSRVLAYRGMHISGITPNLDPATQGHVYRGREIKAWLAENPSTTNYAILDDMSETFMEDLPGFFRTDEATGLTEDIADKVIAHLTAE